MVSTELILKAINSTKPPLDSRHKYRSDFIETERLPQQRLHDRKMAMRRSRPAKGAISVRTLAVPNPNIGQAISGPNSVTARSCSEWYADHQCLNLHIEIGNTYHN